MEGGEQAEVDLNYIMQDNLKQHAYMSYEGFAEKFDLKHAHLTTYELHTPSGIKKVNYRDINIYLPYEVYEKHEGKKKSEASHYKDRKMLEPYEYNNLVKYFPDEHDKWNKVTETTIESGRFGGLDTFTSVRYQRVSQGGGRRKQSRKRKRKSRATRRR